jgi:hypothetical protein
MSVILMDAKYSVRVFRVDNFLKSKVLMRLEFIKVKKCFRMKMRKSSTLRK